MINIKNLDNFDKIKPVLLKYLYEDVVNIIQYYYDNIILRHIYIKYICTYMINMCHDDQVYILNDIICKNNLDTIIDTGNGVSINFNDVTIEMILDIYNYMRKKLNTSYDIGYNF